MQEDNVKLMDKILREKFSEYEGKPSPLAKEAIFKELSKTKNEERPIAKVLNTKEKVYRYAVAASIVLALGIGSYMVVKSTFTSQNTVSKVTQQNIVTESIQPDQEEIIKEPLAIKEPIPSVETRFSVINYITKEKIKVIILPDSSKVYINKNSSLSYSTASFNDEERIVELNGEAYFDVAKKSERPFVIHAGRSRVEVLGTSFNVKSVSGASEVIVESGKVSFSSKSKKAKKIILTRGEKGILDPNNKVRQTQKINPNELSWKTRKLVFSKTPMKEVIYEIERYFGIDIEVTEPLVFKCKYTGVFEEPSKEQVLKIIAISIHGDYSKENDIYILTGKGCN